MPTLLYVDGFKFFFYANDHTPAHVHVIKGEAWAKVELSKLNIVYSSLKQQELKKAISIIEKHQKEFLEAWHEWFSR